MPDSPTRALDAVRTSPFVLDVIRAADRLAAAVRDGGPAAVRLLAGEVGGDDELTATAAVHALGAVFDDDADAVLSALLSDPRRWLREHAAWALRGRLPRLDAVGRLVALVAAGGFAGFTAQRTLAAWAPAAADHVALALEGALAAGAEGAARVRLAETLGLVPGAVATRALRHAAADAAEPVPVRVAAVAALAERPGAAAAVAALARADGELGAAARLAAADLGLRPPPDPPPGGLTVAQLFLHADLDADLTRAGAGDNGGVATLLVRLGAALAGEPGVGRVLTMSRGTYAAADAGPAGAGGHLLAAVPVPDLTSHAARAWPAWVAARRGVRRLLRAYRVDVLHLRMAEVGSLAAADAARALGVPTVFTLAPDPHATIHALDRAGGLRRDNFGEVDQREHYWFRARLVTRLAREAAHVVLFPRPHLHEDMQRLLGLDVAADPRRYTVVPEGVDLRVARAADAELATGGPALDALDEVLAALPAHRRGLPLAVSVGRLHRVKGMATLVQAWARDPDLRDRCNLLVVGGDLAAPSPEEREQLDLIAGVLRRHPAAAAGLLLPGHRPNDVVARWLAAARAGRPPLAAPHGVYVCSSLKEEFGLALLEALAAGLVVVGPDAGGPPTYVADGDTGVLVDTGSPDELAGGLQAALDLAAAADRPARRARAERRLADGFTVGAMADALAGIYAAVAAGERR